MRTKVTASGDSDEQGSHYVELLSSGHQLDGSDSQTVPAELTSNNQRRNNASKRRYVRVLSTSFCLLVGGLASLAVFSRCFDSNSTPHALHSSAASLVTPVQPQRAANAVVSPSPVSSSTVPMSPMSTNLLESLEGISLTAEFEKFVQKHGKQYATPADRAMRFEIFIKNLVYIISHNNENKTSYKLGINQFADMSNEEFRIQHSSGYQGGRRMFGDMPRNVNWDLAARNEDTLPAAMDWRDKGCVNVPKDQKKCGSCWTFSTAGAVEGAYCIKHGTLYDLSEQQMVDCGFPEGNQGCNGGLMDDAFTYIIDAGGICLEKDYPYQAKVGKCHDTSCSPVIHVTGYEDVPNDSELALRTAIAEKGPISVAIDADSIAFQFYKSGVFDTQCGTDLNHAVLAVGYGHDDVSDKDYWIVKNSWGAHWGDSGYIKMRRNTPAITGECGIQMAPSYPVVE